MGDEIELGAVERLFGNAAGKLSMSSTKSAIGHLLGAAGAVEAIFSVLAIRDNIAPPTLNLDNPSVETAIDLVPHTAKKRRDQHGAVELVRLRRHQRIADHAPGGLKHGYNGLFDVKAAHGRHNLLRMPGIVVTGKAQHSERRRGASVPVATYEEP